VSETAAAAPRATAKKPRTRKPAAHREILRLRLAKSGIATPVDQKATIRALGFRRVGQVVEREDSPALRGRIRKIRHLVEVLGTADSKQPRATDDR
jgi:large subunit ribosomal protein L30